MTAPDRIVKGTDQVTFRLEESLREELEQIARDNERSLSAEIRLVLRAHVRAAA